MSKGQMEVGAGPKAAERLLSPISALALSFALLAALAVAFAPSAGAVSHGFDFTFGAASSTPANPYPLSEPTDLDIDQASHDVYVADRGNFRVEKFDAAGNFIFMVGKGVNQTTGGDLCPVSPGDVCKAGTPTAALGGFKKPTYLAVDNFPGSGRGDFYVGDVGNAIGEERVSKFDSAGHLISSWGNGGQKDGRDAINALYEGNFEGMSGLAVGGTCATPDHEFNGECTETPTLYVATEPSKYHTHNTVLYTRNGTFIKWQAVSLFPGFEVDPLGNVFTGSLEVAKKNGGTQLYHAIGEGVPVVGTYQDTAISRVTTGEPTTGIAFDPTTPLARPEFFQDTGSQVNRYRDCELPPKAPCEPADSFGSGHLTGATAVSIDSLSRAAVVANTGSNDVAVFEDIRPVPTTGSPTEVGDEGATLTGHVELAGHGPIVECSFEYGLTTAYGSTAPCEPDAGSSPYAEATDVTAKVTGLTPIPDLPIGSRYHYRLTVVNEEGGSAEGGDETMTTVDAPAIVSTRSSGVTASSAELEALVNPNNLDTSCHFEYGPTAAYGSVAPCSPASLGNGAVAREASAHITGLNGRTYHFRVIAENELGTVTGQDQTFEFFPPSCPNSAVRQQTASPYLPDCRAYELVSPEDANATLLYSGGPTSPYATSPSRFAFTGAYSALPGTDSNIGGVGDLYLATRTATGWGSRYIGPRGDQTGCAGGPPNSPLSMTTHADRLQNPVFASRDMSRIVDFDLGSGYRCQLTGNGTSDATNSLDFPSNAGYLWDAGGASLGRLPGSAEPGSEGLDAFDCPTSGDFSPRAYCTTDVAASGDLTHFVFSSREVPFSPGGLSEPPGSAYDEDLATGETTLISTLPGGEPIPQDPIFASTPAIKEGERILRPGGKEEFIRFPAVSTDGSHILMSTATAPTPFCPKGGLHIVCPLFTDTPIHLYMSIDDEPAIEVSRSEVSDESVGVNFLYMMPDGSRVYFTSAQQLTATDEDTSADLYMWSEKGEEEGAPLTLISKAAPGSEAAAGNSDACEPVDVPQYDFEGKAKGEAPWTAQCAAVPYSQWAYAAGAGGVGGNGTSDVPVASESGDVYFYSPEKLDGDSGFANLQNLYVYRQGSVHYVATLGASKACGLNVFEETPFCASGPIARLQVSADGSHAAFVTQTQLTAYDNANHLEMYLYDPASGSILCASCRPDGQPPSGDVQASQNGLFLTEDGRVFFSTTDALAPRDTNEGVDVYEYTSGRPQLITPGTGVAQGASGSGGAEEERPGLVGVSADGTDVYVATYDTFLASDQNGAFLKFYDARRNGGFASPAPSLPCVAAEECHGPGTSPPQLPARGTAAATGGGNVVAKPRKKRHAKRHHRKHRRRHARGRSHNGRGRR